MFLYLIWFCIDNCNYYSYWSKIKQTKLLAARPIALTWTKRFFPSWILFVLFWFQSICFGSNWAALTRYPEPGCFEHIACVFIAISFLLIDDRLATFATSIKFGFTLMLLMLEVRLFVQSIVFGWKVSKRPIQFHSIHQNG